MTVLHVQMALSAVRLMVPAAVLPVTKGELAIEFAYLDPMVSAARRTVRVLLHTNSATRLLESVLVLLVGKETSVIKNVKTDISGLTVLTNASAREPRLRAATV